MAKELQKRLPEARLIPIVSLLEQKEIQTNADTVGFVFPVHALTIPVAVKRFNEKTDFGSANYLFAVATREGTIFHGFEKIDKILKKSGKQLGAHLFLNMYNNESRHEGYVVPSRDDILALEKPVLEKLDVMKDIIQNKRTSWENDHDYTIDVNRKTEKSVLFAMVFQSISAARTIFMRITNAAAAVSVPKYAYPEKLKCSTESLNGRKRFFATCVLPA